MVTNVIETLYKVINIWRDNLTTYLKQLTCPETSYSLHLTVGLPLRIRDFKKAVISNPIVLLMFVFAHVAKNPFILIGLIESKGLER